MSNLKSSERARELRLKKFFNLTSELWDVIAAYQNSLCFICQKPQKSGKRLATDHSHHTGLLRALLCSTCNRALGRMERTWPKGTDVALMLTRMIEVLTDPPAVRALGREIYTFPGRFGTKRHKKWLREQTKSEVK
jgi:hypothetical protein